MQPERAIAVVTVKKREGKAGRIAQALMRMDLVILDELGYPPKQKRKTPASGKSRFTSVRENLSQRDGH